MDSAALLQVISKIPALKYRYLGCFGPKTFIFPMPTDTFQIVNTTTDIDGHWITLIRLSNGFHYFGDSLKATSLNQYPMLVARLPLPAEQKNNNNNNNNNNNILPTLEHFNKAGRFLVWSLLYLFCMELV